MMQGIAATAPEQLAPQPDPNAMPLFDAQDVGLKIVATRIDSYPLLTHRASPVSRQYGLQPFAGKSGHT